MVDTVAAWESLGSRMRLRGRSVFVVDLPSIGEELGDPTLILHGFPSSSFDWRAVIEPLRAHRRVILLDLLGYGLSEKPDEAYSLFAQADLVEAVVEGLGLRSVVLITHDVGDSVGGELLARSIDGALGFAISARIITNGSIYMDLVQLSIGQQLMLALPDEMLAVESAPTRELFTGSLAATFAPTKQPSVEELDAQWDLCSREDGHRMLPRLIRYINERGVHESRWTTAIEQHPSPLAIVWGAQDPIAVVAMAERLAARRPDATLTLLDEVGHYPMIESPDEVAHAMLRALQSDI